MASSTFRLLVLLVAVVVMAEATPPGIAKNPSHATCKIKKYKHCYNLVHVCPKFCPDQCTVECASCKPICGGGGDVNPPPENDPTPATPSPPSPPSAYYSPPPPTTVTPSPPTSTPVTPSPSPQTPSSPLPPSTGSPSTPPTISSPPPATTPTNLNPPSSPPVNPNPPSTPPTSSYPPVNPNSPPTPPTNPNPPSTSPGNSYPPSNPNPPSSPPTNSYPPTNPNPPSTPPTNSNPPMNPTPPSIPPANPNPPSTPPTNPNPPTPSTPNYPSPSPPSPSKTPSSPTTNTPPPPSPTPSQPASPPQWPPTDGVGQPPASTPPSSSTGATKRVRCKNVKYPQCYNMVHTCPSACPGGCEVDCVTCKPVCHCDRPGAVCQDPRFIGGDGITFYFHGKKDRDFCLVSDPNLHINAHFIGKRNPSLKRDFTWVQSLGILFQTHRLFIAAQKTAVWDDSTDRLTIALDGRPLALPEFEGSQWQNPTVVVVRLAPVNHVMVEVKGLFRITAKAVPITEEDSRVHNYGVTEGDSFAHLDVGFKFFGLNAQVDGVLGQTYAAEYVSGVNVTAAMAVMGREEKFETSSLFATDCAVARFHGGGGDDDEVA